MYGPRYANKIGNLNDTNLGKSICLFNLWQDFYKIEDEEFCSIYDPGSKEPRSKIMYAQYDLRNNTYKADKVIEMHCHTAGESVPAELDVI